MPTRALSLATVIGSDGALNLADVAGLATVAGSGSYTDLTNKPTLFSGSYTDLTNKPTLFSGSYTDLTNKPTLFSGSYTDLTSKPTLFSGSYTDLTNKPTLFSGSYTDLTNKPTLPSGTVVGTSDSQTLTNKTIVDPIVTLGADQGIIGQVPVSQGAGLPPVWATPGSGAPDFLLMLQGIV